MNIIDYDNIDEWEPWIDSILSKIVPKNIEEIIANSHVEYFEDAAEVLYQNIEKNVVVECMIEELSDYFIRVYHGTRLSSGELESVIKNGLHPLCLKDRKHTLIAIFQEHPEWNSVAPNLDRILDDLGAGNRAGKREDGKIHVCFSKNGLLKGCNHYLMYGAEVDWHVASMLFNDADLALKLLALNRKPCLISFVSDFKSALSAANPTGLNNIDVPSLLRLIIEAWAYRKKRRDFNPANLKNCTAAMFHGPKLADELEKIRIIDDLHSISG